MSEMDRWLADYGDSHNSVNNPVLYWPAVLVLVFAVVGVLWSLPVPDEFFAISPILNWGTAFLMAAVVYYFIISVSLAIGMLPFIIGLTALQLWIAKSGLPHRGVSLGLMTVGLVGLVAGQIPDGSPRQVIRDIQMLMIGPFWMLSNIYKRLGIPY
ncbi:MAG: hypothetical protein ACR2QR_14420 [Woeseiaceae bacterium]